MNVGWKQARPIMTALKATIPPILDPSASFKLSDLGGVGRGFDEQKGFHQQTNVWYDDMICKLVSFTSISQTCLDFWIFYGLWQNQQPNKHRPARGCPAAEFPLADEETLETTLQRRTGTRSGPSTAPRLTMLTARRETCASNTPKNYIIVLVVG